VPEEQSKKNSTLTKVIGIVAGFVLITIGMITAPKLGNYSVIVVAAGVSVAVSTFIIASLRSST
jgi:hypothetical protein